MPGHHLPANLSAATNRRRIQRAIPRRQVLPRRVQACPRGTFVGLLMGQVRQPKPCLLIVAGFSRHDSALDWARGQLVERFGPVALTSPTYAFHHTSYYHEEMGENLKKVLWAFCNLIAPDALPAVKHVTNALEEELRSQATYPERRPLNLDPGLLSLGKFMLATTKDQQHRVYLRDGIFAEVTLRYRDGAFQPWPWTYADYREPLVLDFLRQAREYYKQRLCE